MSEVIELEMPTYEDPNKIIIVKIYRELYLIPIVSQTNWVFWERDNDAYPMNEYIKEKSLKTITKLYGNISNDNGVYDFTKCLIPNNKYIEAIYKNIYEGKYENIINGPPISGFSIGKTK